MNRDWFFTPLVLSLLLIGVVWNLIYYVEKTGRNLSLFLLNIKQQGFGSSFKNKNDPNHKLYKVFDDVIEEFHRVTLEKESHFLYLQTLNENVGVGIISYEESGLIDLINPAAKSLLNYNHIIRIDQLAEIDQRLHDTAINLKSGQRTLIKTIIANELIELRIQSKKFTVLNKSFTLLLIQDINQELEQKEVEAWQRLIRVLTHEIMNSVTPISSLSHALNKHLKETDFSTLPIDDQQDIKKSLETIELRSKGLMRFVEAYKEYAKSPELNYSEFSLAELMKGIYDLLNPDLKKFKINWNADIPPNLIIRADRGLIEQVVINIVKNAIDALDEVQSPAIDILARRNMNKLQLEISDNGLGINEEELEKIFVPFYTTKPKGTGVGLSFANKVMRLHDGQIKVSSSKGAGTTFTLIF